MPGASLWTYPGIETLIASSYGIPKPTLPPFESGRESDVALLKMALDNLMSSHPHLGEHYKYQVFLGQPRLPSAFQLAKSFMYDPRPFTAALDALQYKYGQPRQLVQSELGTILNSPAIRAGEAEAFDTFAHSVQFPVGMLRSPEGPGGYELKCGYHFDRLLSKIPPANRDRFVEYRLCRGILQPSTDLTYILPDLVAWLQMKAQAKRLANQATSFYQGGPPPAKRKQPFAWSRVKDRAASVFFTSKDTVTKK